MRLFMLLIGLLCALTGSAQDYTYYKNLRIFNKNAPRFGLSLDATRKEAEAYLGQPEKKSPYYAEMDDVYYLLYEYPRQTKLFFYADTLCGFSIEDFEASFVTIGKPGKPLCKAEDIDSLYGNFKLKSEGWGQDGFPSYMEKRSRRITFGAWGEFYADDDFLLTYYIPDKQKAALSGIKADKMKGSRIGGIFWVTP